MKTYLKFTWRVSCCAVLACALSFLIWNQLFPNTLWFFKLWGALATGSFLGVIIGWIWELSSDTRRQVTPRLQVIATTASTFLMFLLAIFPLAFDLGAQETALTKIRTLGVGGVREISIRWKQGNHSIANTKAITSFVALAHDAELFFPSQEGSVKEFQLTIVGQDGERHSYRGRIPERHMQDIAIEFRAYFSLAELLIPNGVNWLESISST